MGKLTASPVLGGYDVLIGETWLRELTSMVLGSLAVPLGGDQAPEKALDFASGPPYPDSGQSTQSKTHRLIRTGADPALLMFDCDATNAEPEVQNSLSGACYTSLQTDAWVVLEISGPSVRTALERIWSN